MHLLLSQWFGKQWPSIKIYQYNASTIEGFSKVKFFSNFIEAFYVPAI